jgi:hypothetical protein
VLGIIEPGFEISCVIFDLFDIFEIVSNGIVIGGGGGRDNSKLFVNY